MAYLDNTGKNPQGEQVDIPVSGVAASTVTTLGPNQSWSSGIIPYNGNDAVLFAMQSDVAGSYNVEYYEGSDKLNFMGNTTIYDPSVTPAFQGALAGKGDSFQLVYTNGNQAQSSFFCEIRYAESIQTTLRATGVPMSSTNLASTTHAVLEGRENGTGNYRQATTTTEGSKVGMDVFIVNPKETDYPDNQNVTISNPTDISSLAKDSTLTNGNQRTVLVNGNNQIYGSQSNPLNVNNVNQPTVYPINDNGGSITIDGSVSITGTPTVNANVTFPSSQTISGNVGVTGSVEVSNDIGNPLPVTGTLNVGNFPATQNVSITNSSPIAVSGTVGISNSVFPITDNNGSITVDGTVSISGTPTVNIGTIPSVEISNDAGNAIPVSGTVSVGNFPSTQPISASSLPLPSGASTGAKQDIGNSSLSSLDGKTTLDNDGGIKVHIQNPTSNISVTNFPANQTVTVSSIPLATGAATATLQNTGNTSLNNIDTDLGALSDAQATNSTAPWSTIALLKGILSRPSTGTVTNVTTLATSTLILAANPNRKGATIFSITGTILISLGMQNTTSIFTQRIITNGFYEIPFGYTGVIYAIGAGTVTVTEFT